MEALVAWIETWKKYLALGAITLVIGTFFLPHGQIIRVIIHGIYVHLFIGEAAPSFWKGVGLSPGAAQALALIINIAISWEMCRVLLSIKKFGLGKWHHWLASHPWVAKLPWLGIALIGMFIPGGVCMGIFMARLVPLPKTPVTIVILSANVVKLLLYGKILTFFLPHLGRWLS